MSRRRTRPGLPSLATLLLAGSSSCDVGTRATDAGDAALDAGGNAFDQIYVLAADNIVGGGALLGVHVVSTYDFVTLGYDQRAYLVGGLVDVDRGQIPATASVGRLMGYDNVNHFRTLCRTDQVLRAVFANNGIVYAAGDAGRVLTYDPLTHTCTSQTIASDDPTHPPELRAIAGSNVTPLEVFFAGSIESPTGSTTALYAYDGTVFTPVVLPAEAREGRIESLSFQTDAGYWAAGFRGLTLHRAPGRTDWEYQRAPDADGDSDIVSVSGDHYNPSYYRHWTFAMAGDTPSTLLLHDLVQHGWCPSAPALVFSDRVSAMVMVSPFETYVVGPRGYNAEFNCRQQLYTPPQRLTDLDLYAVEGNSGYVIAVGGNIADRTAGQPAVILIRGDDVRTTYEVDGVGFRAAGQTRLEFGGCGEEPPTFQCPAGRDW